MDVASKNSQVRGMASQKILPRPPVRPSAIERSQIANPRIPPKNISQRPIPPRPFNPPGRVPPRPQVMNSKNNAPIEKQKEEKKQSSIIDFENAPIAILVGFGFVILQIVLMALLNLKLGGSFFLGFFILIIYGIIVYFLLRPKKDKLPDQKDLNSSKNNK